MLQALRQCNLGTEGIIHPVISAGGGGPLNDVARAKRITVNEDQASASESPCCKVSNMMRRLVREGHVHLGVIAGIANRDGP